MLVLAAMLGGCATSQRFESSELDMAAKKMLPVSDQGRLYVIRPDQLYGSAVLLKIGLNQEHVGMLGPNNFLVKTISPGQHTILPKVAGYLTRSLPKTSSR